MRTISALRTTLFCLLLSVSLLCFISIMPPASGKPDPCIYAYAIHDEPSAAVPARWIAMGIKFDKQVFVVRTLVAKDHPIYGLQITSVKSRSAFAVNATITNRNGSQYIRTICAVTPDELLERSDDEILASITDCIKKIYQYGSQLEKDRKLMTPEQVVTDPAPREAGLMKEFNKELLGEFPMDRPAWNIGLMRDRGGEYLLVTAPVLHPAGVDHVLVTRIMIKDVRTPDGRFAAAVKTAIRLSRCIKTKTPFFAGFYYFIAATAAPPPNHH